MVKNGNELEIVLHELSETQLRFVAARINTNTDKEAAELAGIPVQTVYNWTNKDRVDLAVRLYRVDSVSVAQARLMKAADQAVDTMIGGLHSDYPFQFAKYILDAVGIGGTQKVDITSGGKELAGLTRDERVKRLIALIGVGKVDESIQQ